MATSTQTLLEALKAREVYLNVCIDRLDGMRIWQIDQGRALLPSPASFDHPSYIDLRASVNSKFLKTLDDTHTELESVQAQIHKLEVNA